MKTINTQITGTLDAKRNQPSAKLSWLRSSGMFQRLFLTRLLIMIAPFLAAVAASAYPFVGQLPTSYAILHNFGDGTNDGTQPYCGLTSSGYGPLFGTTYGGGTGANGDNGTLFEIGVDGSGYVILHNFAYYASDGSPNHDGYEPWADVPLVLGNEIYGTTINGGLDSYSWGTIYTCDLFGSNYMTLVDFDRPNPSPTSGQRPYGQLVSVGPGLYGTTSQGGPTDSSEGTVFYLCGTVFTNFHNFDTFGSPYPTDGIQPKAGLTVGVTNLADTPLFGVTTSGGGTNSQGTSSAGTIFRIDIANYTNTVPSWSYRILHSFYDLGDPEGTLLYDRTNNWLYGTANGGGAGIFRIHPDGTGYQVLFNFGVFSDYIWLSSLVKYGNTLYGVLDNNSGGMIYSIGTDGQNYTQLHVFQGYPNDGANPYLSGLVLTNVFSISGFKPCCPNSPPYCFCLIAVFQTNTILYGTTAAGGTNNNGTIFAMPLSSSSVTNQVPTFPINNPTNNSIPPPGDICFDIDLSNVGPIGEVDYYAGSVHLGTVATSPYSFCWDNPTCGTNLITILVSDTNGVVIAASQEQIIVVNTGVIATFAGKYSLGGTYQGDGGPAIAAGLYRSQGTALDASGNLYIADTWNKRVRKVSNGTITTVAGNGGSYSGDNGSATNAGIDNPISVTVDAQGNLYIAETGGVIRKVNTNGIITTVAGKHSIAGGYSGDGGQATAAALDWPTSVCLDNAGNMYICDCLNCVIRKVNTNGIITTMAGNHNSADTYYGDGGPATSAGMYSPYTIALGGSGNMYIADSGNYVIRKVNTSGTITTVAGNHSLGRGYSGDGGLAINATLNWPGAVSVDGNGNIYIGDNNVIREVGSNGYITTIVGDYSLGGTYSGDGGYPTHAGMNNPSAITVDSSGNLYISDTSNNLIRKVTYYCCGCP